MGYPTDLTNLSVSMVKELDELGVCGQFLIYSTVGTLFIDFDLLPRVLLAS